MTQKTDWRDENIALPIGVWLRDDTTVYMLQEISGPFGNYHKGQPIRENKFCFSIAGGTQEERVELAERLKNILNMPTPTADTGMAAEIAETLWGVTEEQSRALQTPYCTYEPPSEDFKQATIRRYTEAIASRLSTRDQEVGELVEAAEMVAGSQPIVDALRNAQFHYLATMFNEHLEHLRAALDKVRLKT